MIAVVFCAVWAMACGWFFRAYLRERNLRIMSERRLTLSATRRLEGLRALTEAQALGRRHESAARILREKMMRDAS